MGADGTIYIGSDDNNVYALNPNGTQKWKFATARHCVFPRRRWGLTGRSTSARTDGNVYALNPDGTQKWKFATGRHVVFLAGGRGGRDDLRRLGLDDNVYALNPDGTQKWEFATGNQVLSSPAVGADGTIYVGSLDGTVYALH